MSEQLTSGDDDRPTTASGPIDQTRLLEQLQKALEAARAGIDGFRDAPSNGPPDEDFSATDQSAQDAGLRAEREPIKPLQAPPPAPEPVPKWLRTSPPSAPAGLVVASPVRSAPSVEHPRYISTKSDRIPPTPALLQLPQWPMRQPKLDQGEDAKRHLHSVPVEDEDRLEKIFQRLTQRPPATAEEVQDVTRSPRRWLAWAGPVALTSMVGGGVAFCVVQFLNAWPVAGASGQEQRVAPTRTAMLSNGKAIAPAKRAPRLIVSALDGVRNGPLALGVSVEAPPPGATVLVRGMPAGSRITAGVPAENGGWRVPVRDLGHAAVLPPPNFAGAMSLSVDLRLSDGRLADSDVQKLQWTDGSSDSVIPKSVKTSVISQSSGPFPPPPEPRTVGSGTAATGDAVREPRAQHAPAATASRRLDHEELANLLRRGQLALENGDISAARLLLQRAAEAGDAQAELGLAATYDPLVLSRLGALGLKADIAQARAWYQKAADSGLDEAAQRLRQLAQQSP